MSASFSSKVLRDRTSIGRSLLRNVRYGGRIVRRSPGLWSAVVVALVLGIGTGVTALDFVRAGLGEETPVTSPEGLPIPPRAVDLLTTELEPQEPSADSRVWGGAQAYDTAPPTPIADQQAESLEVILGSLGGAAVLVLLLAISNLALLMVSRGGARRSDVAIRGMLGASRPRLVSNLFFEQLPLLFLGAALSAGLITLFRAGLRSTWPSGLTPWLEGGVSPEVVALAVGGPLLTVALCAVLPALLLDERSLRSAAGAGPRTTANASEGRLRQRISVFGVAASVTLLISAGLLFRSFGSDTTGGSVPYDSRDTLTFTVRPAAEAGSADEMVAFNSSILSAVEELEGVRSASVVSEGAWLGLGSIAPVHALTGNPVRPGITGFARYSAASPDAFTNQGAAMLGGRDFDAGDQRGTPGVAVVNQTFANRYFFGSPLGRQVQLGRARPAGNWFTIIGITEDFRPTGIGNADQPEPAIVFSALQLPPPTFDLTARYTGDAEDVREAIERALGAAAPDAIVSFTGTMDQHLTDFRRPLNWLGALFGTLALLAALLGAYGLYGLIAFDVSRRTKEIGIRIALGAPPRSVVRDLLLQGIRTSAAGIVLGLAGALCVGRMLQFTFSGVQLIDPAVILPVVGITALIALAASYLPARGAARVDPVVALAHD